MKAALKAKYEMDKSNASATLAMNAGDVKLRASMTDATFVNGPSLNGIVLSVEKPGFFIVDYNVPRKDVGFQFMNTIKVSEKPLNLTYIHGRGDNRTILDGTLVFDSANKISTNYVFGSGNCKLKYTYVHGGVRTFEPCYDLVKNSWDFAVSQRVYNDDVFRASYQTPSKVFGLDWSRNSKLNGSFKISASLNLAEEVKMPKLSVERPLIQGNATYIDLILGEISVAKSSSGDTSSVHGVCRLLALTTMLSIYNAFVSLRVKFYLDFAPILVLPSIELPPFHLYISSIFC